MEMEFANEWPDTLRDELTTAQVGRIVRLDHVDYEVLDYDTQDDAYVGRPVNQAGQPVPDAETIRVRFPDLRDFLAY